MELNVILESCLYVDDLAKARQFYRDVLRLELIEENPTRHLFWRCGRQMLLLFLAEACDVPDSNVPRHGAHGPGHLAFAIGDHQVDLWRKRLDEYHVPIEQSIRWPQGGHSLYFRDPAGNSLELASPRIWGLESDGHV